MNATPDVVENNPMGTDGFEFIEFAAPDPLQLDGLFRALGFQPVARHRSKDVTLYRQGEINFILNAEPESFAQSFARVHGPSICAIALRVKDARAAAQRAKSLGADVVGGAARAMELNIPAIRGIGGSLIYLVDRYEGPDSRISIYDIDFHPITGAPSHPAGAGLVGVDHLTCVVHPGRLDVWTEFHERLLDFRAFTDPEGRLLRSPCGKIALRVREPSAAEDCLDACHGEGIGQVALTTGSLDAAIKALGAAGIGFREPLGGGGTPRQAITVPLVGPISFSLVQLDRP